MANRFWVGGTGTWDGTAGSKWATTSGGAGGSSVPTSADDVFIDSFNGAATVTTAAGAVCKSLSFNTFGGTFTLANSATALTVHGALTLVVAMSFNPGTGTVTFAATDDNAGAGYTLTLASKSLPHVTFNGAGGKWVLGDALALISGGAITFTNGNLDTNGKNVTANRFVSQNSNTRTLTLGASNISMSQGSIATWDMSTSASVAASTNLTLNANTSTINITGAAATFAGGGNTYSTVSLTGAGQATITGANTFVNLHRVGTAVKTDVLAIWGTQTVSGIFRAQGNSITNRLLVQGVPSSAGTIALGGTAIFKTATTTQHVDFMDIAVTGGAANERDLSGITGKSGDCGGNTGITFTVAVAQTWSGTSGGNWSANAWTTRVPLPQDDVTISAAFSASQTITMDMPRAGGNLSFVGVSGSPGLTVPGVGSMVSGNLTLVAGLGTITSTGYLILTGHSSGQTITFAGKTIGLLEVYCYGGTYTCQDAVTCGTLWVYSGTWDTAGWTQQYDNFIAFDFGVTGNGGKFRGRDASIVLASTATSTIWNWINGVFTADTSTIVIGSVSTNTRTFAGGGQAYGGLQYSVAGSSGILVIADSNSFLGIIVQDSTGTKTLRLTAGTTQTILPYGSNDAIGLAGIKGRSGANIVMDTTGAAANIVSAKNQSVKFVTMTNWASSGGGIFRAYNSTNSGGNTDWIFTVPSSPNPVPRSRRVLQRRAA